MDDDYDIEEGNHKIRLSRKLDGQKDSSAGYCCY